MLFTEVVTSPFWGKDLPKGPATFQRAHELSMKKCEIEDGCFHLQGNHGTKFLRVDETSSIVAIFHCFWWPTSLHSALLSIKLEPERNNLAGLQDFGRKATAIIWP